MNIAILMKEKEDFLKLKNQKVCSAVWCVAAQEKAKTNYQEEKKWKNLNKTIRNLPSIEIIIINYFSE